MRHTLCTIGLALAISGCFSGMDEAETDSTTPETTSETPAATSPTSDGQDTAPPVEQTTADQTTANGTPDNPPAEPSSPEPAPSDPTTSETAPPRPEFMPWTHQLTGKPEDSEPPYAYDLDVSPDGRRVAAACVRRGKTPEGVIRILDADTGELIQDIRGHSAGVATVEFTADGSRVYSGSWDITFRRFNVETGEEEHRARKHSWPVLTLDLSKNGKRAVSGSDGLRVWDLESGEVVRQFEKLHPNNPLWSVKMLPDGTQALGGSGDGRLGLWNLEQDDEPRILGEDLGRIKSVDVSPDGRLAVVAASDRPEITIIDIAAASRVRQWKAHGNGIANVLFSPDGEQVLSAGGELLPRTRDFNPDTTDHSIRLWDVQTGKEVAQVGDHETYVSSLAFSPDGKRVYSAAGDGTVRAQHLKRDQ